MMVDHKVEKDGFEEERRGFNGGLKRLTREVMMVDHKVEKDGFEEERREVGGGFSSFNGGSKRLTREVKMVDHKVETKISSEDFETKRKG
ncbi:uncharacterized protein LOC143143753 isoform X3 [Ptiloglossa arizonensis]